MTKEFETLKNIYLTHQNNSLKDEQIKLTNLEREKKELFNLGQQRAFYNQNLFNSCGVKELFEQIKSEGILVSDVEIKEGIPLFLSEDKLKDQIGVILGWPGRKINEARNNTDRWVDKHSFISLSWDHIDDSEYGDNRYPASSKNITIGAREGNLFLRFPIGYQREETIKVSKSNLSEKIAYALTQTKQIARWDNTDHVHY